MEAVPLTPTVVDCVTFDRAPLGRRGYNEDQVDDLLDRVQATLAGNDNLTAHDVRTVVFDPAAFIRRGYHEDQVDEFLDLVVEELDRREGNLTPQPPGSRTSATSPAATPPPQVRPAPFTPQPALPHAPTHLRQMPPPTAAEQTAPMLFAQPPSLPFPGTRPLTREQSAASGPPKSSVAATPDKTAPRPSDAPSSANGVAQAEPRQETPPSAAQAIPQREPDDAAHEPDDAATVDSPALPPTEAEPPSTAAETAPQTQQAPPATPERELEETPTHQPAAASQSPTQLPAAEPDPTRTPVSAATRGPKPATAWEPPPELDAWRDSDHLVLPLPPAPPGERGYRPGDVERLMKVLAAALDDADSPDPGQLANLKLARTFFVGQGYHAGVVDTLRQAWVDELDRRVL